MVYKIAICEDDPTDLTHLSKKLAEWAALRAKMVQIETFSSAEAFLFRYEDCRDFDLLLLDIEMAEMDGMSLAKQIREDDCTIDIIFVTGYPDYIGEGYDVGALHYLLKPIRDEKLYSVLDRAAEAACKPQKSIVLKVGGTQIRIKTDEILYAEAFAHTVEIHTINAVYAPSISISELETLLGKGFVRCHRSYLVALSAIEQISRTEILLDNAVVIPVSRSAYNTVNQEFIAYYRGIGHEDNG